MIFKKENGVKFITPIVFIISCLRVYSYIAIEKLFFDVYERTILDAPRFWATIALTITLSMGVALFTGRVMKENGNLFSMLIIFVADPVFFSSQDNITVLFLSSLFVLSLYIYLRTSNLLTDSIVFTVFAFFSTLLIPQTIYSTVPILLAVILIKYFGSFYLQKIKALVLVVLSVIAVISAYILNDEYTRELFLANKFINGKTSYFYKPSLILLVFSVLLLAGCILLICKASVFAKSKVKKKNFEYINEDSVSLIYLTIILIVVCFFLQIFAYANESVPPSYSAINIFAPVMIIFLFVRHKNSFDSVFEGIYTFWNNHFGLCFVSLLFLALLYFRLSKDCFTATNILKYSTLYLT